MSKARDLADSAQEINILDGKSFLDEDNLASDSATGIASQQSIKAYVDGITTTNITSTGALNSGSITSGFGNIDNGSSTITTTGAITGGSFVIGSADINENDLESIDGITAGTVAASKAVVVNANKDITGFRNLTATGTISGTLSGTLSGSLSSTTTATTQAESDDSTKVATTAYVTDKITTLIGGAPSTLNDLNELAAAINDDANYNSTLTTALGTKLAKAGGTLTGDVAYLDNVKAKFGHGDDLQIYHDGSQSFIKEGGTGELFIQGDTDVRITNSAGSEFKANFITNGPVDLYYDNSKKLATTSTGIQVTGNIANASGDLTLDVAGNIVLDADGGGVYFKDAGVNIGFLQNSGANDFRIVAGQADKDIVFMGNDGGSAITALTLDMSQAGEATFNGGVRIPGFITHVGDDNTFFGFPAGDQFRLETAGLERMSVNGSATTFNEDGENVDFRVESDGNENMLFVDAGNNRIGVGTSSPQCQFHSYTSSGSNALRVSGGGNVNAKVEMGFDDSAGPYIKGGSSLLTSLKFYVDNTSLALTLASNRNATFAQSVTATTFHGDGSNLTGVGGSTTLGAVGTYALIRNTNSTYGAGSTVAFNSFFKYTAANNQQIGSPQPSGTWRAMGYADYGQSTVWVRIS